MSKSYKILLTSLVALLVLLTYLEASEPDEINWNPSYVASDKIPLGTRVLYENLQDQNFPVKQVNSPPFEFLNDSSVTGTYFFLNDRLDFHDSELHRLLKWIEKGNSVFLIAENISPNLLDTLGLELEIAFPKNSFSSKPMFNLTDMALQRKEPFLFDRETYQYVFSKYDSLQQKVLGISQLYSDSLAITEPKPNFLMDSIGKGAIYLNTSPKAFSNFFLLEDDNYEYAARALGYIPTEKTLYWDQYYKSGKVFYTSPLFVLLNNKPLKWAYYFAIIGGILFILFEGKRRQRSIRVIEPLKNQTYHFTRTVAGLHLNQKDYKGIASKKIALFLDYVRTHYRISTEEINETSYQQLAGISNSSPEEVKNLWEYMASLESKQEITKEDLLKLNKEINAFKKRTHG